MGKEISEILSPENLARVIIAVIIFIFLKAKFTEKEDGEKTPKKRVKSRLVNKLTGTFGDAEKIGAPSYTSYTLVFLTADGEELSFAVSAEVFAVLKEGQQGFLTYQGSKFINFG